MTIRMEVNHRDYAHLGGFDGSSVGDAAIAFLREINDHTQGEPVVHIEGGKTKIRIPCQPINNMKLAKHIDQSLRRFELRPKVNSYEFYSEESGQLIR